MGWGGGRGNLREGPQEKVGTFFLGEAAEEENEFHVRGDAERFAKDAAFRQRCGRGHAISAQNNFFRGNSAGDQFTFFLFGGGDDGRGVLQHVLAHETVIGAFEEEVPNDGHEHADGFDDVGNIQLMRGRGGARAEKIVEAENVDDVEILQASAQVARQGGIPTGGVVMKPVGEVDGFDAADFTLLAERTVFRGRFTGELREAAFEAPISGEDGDFVAQPRQAFGKRANLFGRAAKLKKWHVALRDVQDSHSSRRIFLKVLEKMLKRYSCSTRWRPASPIWRAFSGLESRVSMEVASWTVSPCCTT